jgi:uncharacterized protein (TIGR02284 family)
MKKFRSVFSLALGLTFMTAVSSAYAVHHEPDTKMGKEAVGALNDLIETAKNGQEGYKVAASGVDDPKTKAALQKFSDQRAQFAEDLKGHVRTLGGDAEKGGSPLGAAHRGWINIKAAVSQKDEAAILAECKKGDDTAIKNYEGALDKNLPETVRAAVNAQLEGIKATFTEVTALENRHEVGEVKREAGQKVDKAMDKADDNTAAALNKTQDAY